MSPRADGGQAPQDSPAWEGLAARKSQRGAFIAVGTLVATGVALAVLAAVILVDGRAHHSSASSAAAAATSAASASAASSAAAAPKLAKKARKPVVKTWQLGETELRAGDCLTGSDLGLGTNSAWPVMFTAMSCTQPHLGEVFYVGYPWPESLTTYPGDSAVANTVDERCNAAFTAYVGVGYSSSGFAYDTEGPTNLDDWTTGDREIVCVAYEAGQTLNYSIKGTRQ